MENEKEKPQNSEAEGTKGMAMPKQNKIQERQTKPKKHNNRIGNNLPLFADELPINRDEFQLFKMVILKKQDHSLEDV